MNIVELIVDKDGKISEFLSDTGFPYGCIYKFFKNKDIKINGRRIAKETMVKAGDRVSVYTLVKPEKQEKKPKFEIFYEDKNIYIVNKKSGIETIGDEGLEGAIPDAIAVHRLDTNTEGLLVMARNHKSEQVLKDAFKDRTVTKKYLCEVYGATHFNGNTFRAYLIKDAERSKVQVTKKHLYGSVEIKTKFKTLKSTEEKSLVECELLTGKTHQIRASLSFLKHPIIGDNKYGFTRENRRTNVHGQRLHSYFLQFHDLKEPLGYLNEKEFVCYPKWLDINDIK